MASLECVILQFLHCFFIDAMSTESAKSTANSTKEGAGSGLQQRSTPILMWRQEWSGTTQWVWDFKMCRVILLPETVDIDGRQIDRQFLAGEALESLRPRQGQQNTSVALRVAGSSWHELTWLVLELRLQRHWSASTRYKGHLWRTWFELVALSFSQADMLCTFLSFILILTSYIV